jgi:hypothetical protein
LGEERRGRIGGVVCDIFTDLGFDPPAHTIKKLTKNDPSPLPLFVGPASAWSQLSLTF